MNNVSVLILTLNEEVDLAGCLESVAWSDDVHVLDSGSTDRTATIARRHGVNWHMRPFDGYASQRNHGLRLPFRHEWLLILDADERVPAELRDEIQSVTALPELQASAFRLQRRDFWWGRWLKHAQISPFYVRLVRPIRAHYEREVNEVIQIDGAISSLRSPLYHYPFSKGLRQWIEKHNRYSSMEADLILNQGAGAASWRAALFEDDFNIRRVHQKRIFYRLPARPLLKLLYMLLVRGALLDGWPGIRYAILQAIYEYFIVLKVKEANRLTRSNG